MTGIYNPLRYVSPTGDERIDGLVSGYAWDGTITYAFPTSRSAYSYGGEPDYKFASISAQQTSAAMFFLEQSFGSVANDGFSVEGFTNANIERGETDTATVRLAQSSYPDLSTAWAYEPGADEVGGDVWFGTQFNYRFPGPGNYAAHALFHEIGHALGLKHAHEPGFANSTVVPADYNSLEYTVMTYRTYIGDVGNTYRYEQNSAPQTFMMLDIAALQDIYGADYETNSGDTVYKWTPKQGTTYVNGVAALTPTANRIFATIWDGGGIDTYDLSAFTTSLKIDLQPGGYSVFSQAQLAYLGGGPNNGYARGNIFNALLYQGNVASLIENVQAGSGSDVIVGNDVSNSLWGNAGNDTLDGGAGVDILHGGVGDDTYVVDDVDDVVIELVKAGTDTVRTTLSAYTLGGNVERLAFSGAGGFHGTGNALANVVVGGEADDTLDGGAGDDILDGESGADTLVGGIGNDIYLVDDAGDIIVESIDEGADLAKTTLSSYQLTGNVERLTYVGTANFSGTGNALANVITGGTADDLLDGAGGGDTLIGGAGNDLYLVDNIQDAVIEAVNAGTDEIRTSLSAYTIVFLTNIENLSYSGASDFAGIGNSLANRIVGGSGSDTLDGKAGSDTIVGGVGDDVYIIDNAGDVVTEEADEGNDTIKTVLAVYSLASRFNVENLTYTGTAAFSGTGNGLANTITGGAGVDMLDGGAGADMLAGGAGNDTYVVDDVGDSVLESANGGIDLIRTALSSYSLDGIANVERLTFVGGGNFAGTGNALANIITGGVGNDILDGGAGADTLVGGAGNDVYIVDNVSDIVSEATNAGIDEISTSLSGYSLAKLTTIENLSYIGTGAFSGTGNALANTISGGIENDTLDGGAGADRLIGGAGNDSYSIDNGLDVIVEDADGGIDTVRTSLASYTLGTNVENLTFTGKTAFNGAGNELDNVIVGGAGSNVLTGGAGNDTLIGGAAADFFVYTSNFGHDTIFNFVTAGAGHDTIRIDHTIFDDWASLLSSSSQLGGDTIVTADDNNTITLKNVAVSSLQSSDFFFT